MSNRQLHILCISRFFKGNDFLRSCHDAGHNVYLLTSKKLEHEPWAKESLEDVFYMVEDEHGKWNHDHLIGGLAHKMRSMKFDFFVALDDFDVEHVAFLREYFRIPGMGETTARYFRDKLAMRIKSKSSGIPVPAFTNLFHDSDIQAFVEKNAAPWLIKPRMQASSTGIQKIHSEEDLWLALEQLGGLRHEYLLEKFAPGDVYHVDSLYFNGKKTFTQVSKYLNTPFEVAHGGGIFRSVTLANDDPDKAALIELNEEVMHAFGMQYSASHSEFIKNHETGHFFFLETASRVGGANLAEMVEASTGINLWREWAKIEIAQCLGKQYVLPKVRQDNAGIIVSLSKYEKPDLSSFEDKEVVWRMDKKHHIGMILQSKNRDKILTLLDKYAERIKNEFHASMPSPHRPTS